MEKRNDINITIHKEQMLALLIVWVICSIITTIITLSPFLVNHKTILQNTPTCISISQHNVECSLCGMTRSFLEISEGNFNDAYTLNKGGIYIYSAFLINSIVFLFYLINLTNQKKTIIKLYVNSALKNPRKNSANQYI